MSYRKEKKGKKNQGKTRSGIIQSFINPHTATGRFDNIVS